MASVVDSAVDIPQWKKDLIARLKNNHNKTATVGTDQQLNPSPQLSPRQLDGIACKNGESVTSGGSVTVLTCTLCDQCDVNLTSTLCVKPSKMVQECVWVDNKRPLSEIGGQYKNGYHKSEDSDPEDLHYGPGIVKKLKNKYLSLALRESNARPSILHLRKATSLENLLEDDVPSETRQFQPRINGNERRNVPNRYRNAARGEIKRARSVETISRLDNIPLVSNRQSLHEDMLISNKEGNGHRKTQDKIENNVETIFSNIGNRRINRPKRIQPLMNEKEKPPVDFVKQAKMIFERRPEQRTRAPPQTGDVAAKVDSFNNIIVKAKVEAIVSKKPPIKYSKPVLNDKLKSNTRSVAKLAQNSNAELNKMPKIEVVSLPSPIPDISRIDFPKNEENENGKNCSLSETPDLILTSSPLPTVSSPTFKQISADKFLKEEIRNSSPILGFGSKKFSSPILSPTRIKPASPLLSPSYDRPSSPKYRSVCDQDGKLTAISKVGHLIQNSQVSPTKLEPNSPNFKDDGNSKNVVASKASDETLAIFNFGNNPNENISETKTPTNEPLKIEVNGFGDQKVAKVPKSQIPRSPPKFSPPPPPKIVEQLPESVLSVTEIEKNHINTVKNAEVVNKNVVTKKSVSREQASTTAVFNFTSRKDVPDYISNDKSRSPSRPELPKPGEGGIILLPTSNLELFGDEDEEEIRNSLECPPSPCDVTFVNDNILIDGKSSLSQKTKRAKLRISFVDGPEIYEYPSETSLMLDESLISPVGHAVPNLSGCSLANYTPKSTEAFQPGITRSIQQTITSKPDVTDVSEPSTDLLLQESDTPFSSGTNADILF